MWRIGLQRRAGRFPVSFKGLCTAFLGKLPSKNSSAQKRNLTKNIERKKTKGNFLFSLGFNGGKEPFVLEKPRIQQQFQHRHPNIVNLYGILLCDEFDKSAYLGYVMEYVKGGSLHDGLAFV